MSAGFEQSGWAPAWTKYRQLTPARSNRYVRSVHAYGGGLVLPGAARLGRAISVTQVIGSVGSLHLALHPDTMSRWAGRLQEFTPSNMWSCSTKWRAYAQ